MLAKKGKRPKRFLSVGRGRISIGGADSYCGRRDPLQFKYCILSLNLFFLFYTIKNYFELKKPSFLVSKLLELKPDISRVLNQSNSSNPNLKNDFKPKVDPKKPKS